MKRCATAAMAVFVSGWLALAWAADSGGPGGLFEQRLRAWIGVDQQCGEVGRLFLSAAR